MGGTTWQGVFVSSGNDVIYDVIPLAICLFLVSLFGLNHCLGRKAYRISERTSLFILILVTCLLTPGAVFYITYEPPDSLLDPHGPWKSCSPSPPNRTGIRVKIISYADGKATALGKVSGRINAKYADTHAYGFHMYHNCRPLIRHLQWTKIALLHLEMQDSTPGLEWLVWIDADAVFVEQSYDLYEEYLETLGPEIDLVVAEDLGGDSGRPINTGIMMLRVGERGKRLMELIWDTGRDLHLLRDWFHEQGTLSFLYDSDPDLRNSVIVLGNKAVDDEVRVKMFTDGSIDANVFSADTYSWRPGDHIAHAIGPKKHGGTDKMKALLELERYIGETEAGN